MHDKINFHEFHSFSLGNMTLFLLLFVESRVLYSVSFIDLMVRSNRRSYLVVDSQKFCKLMWDTSMMKWDSVHTVKLLLHYAWHTGLGERQISMRNILSSYHFKWQNGQLTEIEIICCCFIRIWRPVHLEIQTLNIVRLVLITAKYLSEMSLL